MSQNSANFDMMPPTSTASTSSIFSCLFFDHKQKRSGKKLQNLVFPQSETVPLQIKNIAINLGDSLILPKLESQTIVYHQSCYAAYQSKEKRSIEESTKSSYAKYRQLHKLAFQSILAFITTEIYNRK
ncbi:unnamed protein product [Callosobruchus maculatus]|uniref:Uncharacterized protein n=1 Tax=Callosobruchus maculatus TaxID=64391 RepID=A0A653D245_CALMS|nr:unnamed protein product [Callosobruchus maculatus]